MNTYTCCLIMLACAAIGMILGALASNAVDILNGKRSGDQDR